MNDIEQSKLDRFAKDEVMLQSVHKFIRNFFLKGKGNRDVQILAAERLAVDFLDDAWRELEKYNVSEDNSSPPSRQVGL